MDKLVLLSVIGASVAVPMMAARLGDPRRALRLCLFAFVGFNAVYIALLFLVFPRLV
ncbi:MAG: hypothetical protein ABIJ09_08540 [Pseudomonadota bacterium]